MSTESFEAIQSHPNDNVATALTTLAGHQTIHIQCGGMQSSLSLLEDIPYGHKFATKDIDTREPILKYGEVIGVARFPIKVGMHAHVHNIESQRGRGDLAPEVKS